MNEEDDYGYVDYLEMNGNVTRIYNSPPEPERCAGCGMPGRLAFNKLGAKICVSCAIPLPIHITPHNAAHAMVTGNSLESYHNKPNQPFPEPDPKNHPLFGDGWRRHVAWWYK